MIGGTGQNHVEGGYTVQISVLCAKSGIQCELCGRWYHYRCGSEKAQGAERERERSGTVKSVGLKMCECYRRNCKTRCDKLMY